MAQQTTGARANALTREFAVGAEATSGASAEQVYEVLADLRSHRIWAGDRQKKSGRLLSIEAPEGPASVGTEFTTTGSDPMGRFADRSVVTEATRPREFEFVTESRLETRKGEVAEWTNVHRYELTPTEDGCRVTYRLRVARISALPGMLKLLNAPVLGSLARKASAGVGRRGVQNLVALAEERAGIR
jgi:hypothetical protein